MDALSNALGLALPLFKPDAASLPTVSACVDANLLMLTSQEILFQHRDLAQSWGPALPSSFHTPSRPPDAGTVRGVCCAFSGWS